MISFVTKHRHIEILLVTLLFVSCFGLILLDFRGLKYIFTFTLFFFCIRNKGVVPYKKTILLYAFFVLCSCLYSAIFNHQHLIRLIGRTYEYLGILFAFVIMAYRPSIVQLEKVIKSLSVTFCLCYLVQWAIYPISIFRGSLDELNIGNDIFRMRMSGSICAYCLYFYGINKFMQFHEKKYLLYSFLGFLPIIIMGFRSLTALTLAFTFIMIPFINRKISKVVIASIFGIILLFIIGQLDIVQTKIDEMLERQKSGQTFDNKDYIRYIEYEYFTEVIFTRPEERFFGGGNPIDESTSYYKTMYDAADRLHFYWQDLGIIGLSFIIGIPAVILLVWIVLKCIFQCYSPHLQYIRFTLLTVLLGSVFTSMELYRTSNLLIISLYMCLVYLDSLKNRHCKYNKIE